MIYAFVVALPLILAAIFEFVLPHGPYEFDFDQPHGTFISVLPHFTRFFYAIALLGVVGAMLGWLNDAPMLMLLLSAADALLFNILIVLFYEAYLHVRYPRNGDAPRSNYTLRRYSFILALGTSSVVLLFGGVALLIRGLAKP